MRTVVDVGRAILVKRSKRDKVREVLEKGHTDDSGPTFSPVGAQLDLPVRVGYRQDDVVVETASRGAGFRAGDRVATTGVAESATLPRLMAARSPDAGSFEGAALDPVATSLRHDRAIFRGSRSGGSRETP